MGLKAYIQAWAEERSWPGRAVLILLLGGLATYLSFDPEGYTPMAPINLVFHELGHPLFAACGEWLHIAGGTILQLALPFIILVVLLRQKELFGLPFAGVWLGASFLEVAAYMAHCTDEGLQLFTLGFNTGGEAVEIPYTDWEYLLDHTYGFNVGMNLTVAGGVRVAAFCILWGSILIGLWLLWLMVTRSRAAVKNADAA